MWSSRVSLLMRHNSRDFEINNNGRDFRVCLVENLEQVSSVRV